MKRFLAVLLALVMMMALVACGGKEEAPAAKEEPKTEAPAAKEEAPAAKEEAPATGYDVSDCDPVEIILPTAANSAAIETIYLEKWMDRVTELSEGKAKLKNMATGESVEIALDENFAEAFGDHMNSELLNSILGEEGLEGLLG